MASPANAAILDGMPHPADLRVHHHEGTTFVTAGQMVIACYPGGEIAMRNVAVAVARQLGFSGQQVAQVMGLTDSYVATLHQRALREGAAGLVRPSGPKPKLSPQAWARAAKWRAAGGREGPVGAPPGGGHATVTPRLARPGPHEAPAVGRPPAGAEAGGDDGAVQARDRRRGRAAGGHGVAARAADPAAPAGRDRRRVRPAGAAGHVRAGHA